MSGPQLQLYTIGDDGSGRRDLPERGATPSWTPDGRIIYGTLDGFVRIVDADGGNPKTIGPRFPGIAKKPQLAGGVVSFAAPAPPHGADGVWVMQENGS